MMRQYQKLKAQYEDALLFFRLGDFYELFAEDARIAARELEITLTSRNRGEPNEVPLCGVPCHSAEPYIARLVGRGYKVAVCEQTEDPSQAKGLVAREVVRVVTPGLQAAGDQLQPTENNYLAALAPGSHQDYGLAALDLSTGEFRVTQLDSWVEVQSELLSLDPKELLLPASKLGEETAAQLPPSLEQCRLEWSEPDHWQPHQTQACIKHFFACSQLEGFGCAHLPLAQSAAGAVLAYVEATQKGNAGHITSLQTYFSQDSLLLDATTRRNLELVSTLYEGKRRGSLLDTLDHTMTAMGARRLRHWIQHPLIDKDTIVQRQQGVAELQQQLAVRQQVRESLDAIYDLERLTGKIVMGTAHAKDLRALHQSLAPLPQLKEILYDCHSACLQDLAQKLDSLADVAARIDATLVTEPPFVLREGGLIRSGWDEQVDELRSIQSQGKDVIAGLEQEERQKTGISNLKVRFNKVFGYYIEVTRAQAHKVPEEYRRKQTLANAERYITEALKEYESKVLGAEERLVQLEYDLFVALRQDVAAHKARLQTTAALVAELDALQSLAEIAYQGGYVQPQMAADGVVEIVEGRHPVVERMDLGTPFVPNDLKLDTEENQVLLLTGPNMAGKSTYMRQCALLVLMAQMGGLIPATRARIGIVDRIFTRVGASDVLAKGQSTFMVEMSETAYILRHATCRSLVILDEIGRGTSTYDGLSLAWAVAEYLHDTPAAAAKTLFATHYHELTQLALTRSRMQNYNVLVKEHQGQVVFLHRIQPGASNHSYGIEVARLAGLPQTVLNRAQQILGYLEDGRLPPECGHYQDGDTSPEQQPDDGQPHDSKQDAAEGQPALFSWQEEFLRQRLQTVDIDHITPMEALNLLHELKASVSEC